jgi:hypothetical protein
MIGERSSGFQDRLSPRYETPPKQWDKSVVIREVRSGVQLGDRISRRGLEAFSGSCYELLGVRPFLGRLIGEQDAPFAGVSAPVTVVTYSFWKTALNGDPQIVGRILIVEGKPLTIIGVLPESFAGMHGRSGPDIVVPLGLTNTLMGLPPVRSRCTQSHGCQAHLRSTNCVATCAACGRACGARRIRQRDEAGHRPPTR